MENYDKTAASSVEREIAEETGIQIDPAFLMPFEEASPRIIYTRDVDGVERGRPTRRLTQAFIYEASSSDQEKGQSADGTFRERADF